MDEQQRVLQEIISMLGADPRVLGLTNALTMQNVQDPMAVNEKIGGTPSFYQGSKLGAYIYPPGPVQQSHPMLGALGGWLANRRNQLERRRVMDVLAGLGRQPQAAASPAASPPQDPTTIRNPIEDILKRIGGA